MVSIIKLENNQITALPLQMYNTTTYCSYCIPMHPPTHKMNNTPSKTSYTVKMIVLGFRYVQIQIQDVFRWKYVLNALDNF